MGLKNFENICRYLAPFVFAVLELWERGNLFVTSAMDVKIIFFYNQSLLYTRPKTLSVYMKRLCNSDMLFPLQGTMNRRLYICS